MDLAYLEVRNSKSCHSLCFHMMLGCKKMVDSFISGLPNCIEHCDTLLLMDLEVICLNLSVLAALSLSAAQLQTSNFISQSFLLFLYSVWWYLQHHLKADKAAVAAYSVETPIIQKIMTDYSDFSFYKTAPSLCLQFKEDLRCVTRCCTLGFLCDVIPDFACMFCWFKFVQIVGGTTLKANLCKQNNFLLNSMGLGHWVCSALEPGFVGDVLHILQFQARGLGKTQVFPLNVLISFVSVGKGTEAILGDLRGDYVFSGALWKGKGKGKETFCPWHFFFLLQFPHSFKN